MDLSATVGNERISLPEGELHPGSAICPVCRTPGGKRLFPVQRNPDVWLQECSRCLASFVDRMPTEAALGRYYGRYYDQPKYSHQPEARVHFAQPLRLARHIFSITELSVPPGGEIRLLDFGGGDGTVSLLLAEQLLALGAGKACIHLVDPHPHPRRAEYADIQLVRLGSVGEATTSSYDLVIASASLEHVPDMHSVLTALAAATRFGGRLYCRTPFVAPLIKVLGRVGLRLDFGFPAHLYDLGPQFWEAVPETIKAAEELTVMQSRPSIVESTFSSAFWRTAAAYLLKAPWALLGNGYKLVGGWEVVFQRKKRREGRNIT